MTRLGTRILLALVTLATITTAGILLWRDRGPASSAPFTLVTTLRSEPRSFNRLLAEDRASLMLSQLIHAPLLRVNHVTQEIEPVIAASWASEDGGLRYRITLRDDARFSDGSPVTAHDVAFSLGAAYDARVGSPLADILSVARAPIAARVIDPRTVVLEYPAPHGPGLRPLHALPILPKARYAAALASGTLAESWSLTAPPASMVAAGPFIVDRYEPGRAIHLRRNSHFRQGSATGAHPPHAEGVRMAIVPGQDAEMMQLQSGAADLTTAELRPDDLPMARQLEAQGRLQVFDLGVSLDADFLWINLAAGAPRVRDRPWLQAKALREAIAHAVDRQAFINAVYQGAAAPVVSFITPGNRAWHADDLEPREASVTKAAGLLDGLGLRDRDGDGIREDAQGRRATFTLLVQQGHTVRQRAATVLQEALRTVGLQVEIATLDPRGLIQRLQTGAYDAMYHGLPSTDTDPAGLMEFWMSSGRFHVWHPAQTTPATPWEARIDDLMMRQLTLTDHAARRALVVEAQHILHRELPIIVFAAPRVFVATSARLTGVQPGLLSPHVLWNAAAIGVR